MKLISDEAVRVLHLDVELFESCLWEVVQVERHDRIRVPNNCDRENVPIIFIRQFQRRNERLMARHNAIGDGVIHQADDSGKLVRKLWTIFGQIAYPLVVYLFAPLGVIKPFDSQAHQHVSH